MIADLPELRAAAGEHGVDLLGVARMEQHIHPELDRVVVLVRHTPNGVTWAKHPGTKQYAGARALKLLGEAGVAVAGQLEAGGARAMPLAPAAIDFGRSGPEALTPAGQGTMLAREAAVAAGLATWGLNRMVLTPEYGPRVRLAAVLTDAPLQAGRPLETELCPGYASCGRCAAVCPSQAIPTDGPRGLDGAACASVSQPFAADAFVGQVKRMFAAGDKGALAQLIRVRTTGELWQEATFLKEGAYTACSRCQDVCPVGADWAVVGQSPYVQSLAAGA
ncbi:MAG: hypothetical protein KGJ86_03390 [Chloroflexota bacterium]|nr:hypothetical protein [Chloroflexota bacterium]